MLVEQWLWHRRQRRCQLQAKVRHAGGQFKHSSIVNSVARILALGKRSVIGGKHHRHILRVNVAFAEALDNRQPGWYRPVITAVRFPARIRTSSMALSLVSPSRRVLI